MDLSKWKQEKSLIEEAYSSLYPEAMQPKKSELTEREKFKLAAAAAKDGKGPLAKPKDKQHGRVYDAEEIKNEGSDSFGYNQGKGKHWKEYRKKFDDDPGYQQLKQKMQAEYDAKKKKDDAENEKPKEESISPDDMDAPVDDTIETEQLPVEPDEVDAEIDSLKSLLQNPDPERIEQYASEGRLEDYITMLQKKLDAAKAVKDVIRGKDGG